MSYQITEVFVSIQTLVLLILSKKYSTLVFVKTEGSELTIELYSSLNLIIQNLK